MCSMYYGKVALSCCTSWGHSKRKQVAGIEELFQGKIRGVMEYLQFRTISTSLRRKVKCISFDCCSFDFCWTNSCVSVSPALFWWTIQKLAPNSHPNPQSGVGAARVIVSNTNRMFPDRHDALKQNCCPCSGQGSLLDDVEAIRPALQRDGAAWRNEREPPIGGAQRRAVNTSGV